MINDVDDVLQQLLIRELPIKNGEVDIEFHQPRREWSVRLNRPTLNVFLHDLRENNVLRQPEWQITRNTNGTVTKQRSPTRMNLHYAITAWAAEPEDEHRLLTRTVMALLRTPELPEDLLPASLKNQPMPILVRATEHDALRNTADLWGVLDNELRPAIACTVTLALNPYAPITGPLVRSRELRFRQAVDLPGVRELSEGAGVDKFWMVGGTLRSAEPLANARMELLERGLKVPITQEGKFIIGNLQAGEYTLEVTLEGRKPRQHKLTVPSPQYEFSL